MADQKESRQAGAHAVTSIIVVATRQGVLPIDLIPPGGIGTEAGD
jgi:hypothetical protein